MHRVPASLVLLCLVGSSCDKQGQGQSPGGPAIASERAIAVVGDHVVTIDEVQESLNREQAFVRSRYGTPEKVKEYLDNLIRFEVLYQEGRRRGFDNDPDIIRIFKQQMVARLLQKDFEPQHDPAQISPEMAREYWESHKEEFHDPEKVRASHILVLDPKLAEDAAKAAKALRKDDEAGWAQLVNLYSTDIGSKPVAGDLGFLARNKNVKEVEVLQAAFAMTEPGAIAGPIKSAAGFHIIRYTGRKPAVERTFEEVEKQVSGRVYKSRRAAALSEWVANLSSKAKIETFPDKISQIKVDLSDTVPKNTDPPFFELSGDFLPGAVTQDEDEK